MPATVYYADMHCRSHEDSKIAKVARLCDALNLKKIIKKKELAAIKLHFGEYGNDTHLNPTLVRQVVNKIMAEAGKRSWKLFYDTVPNCQAILDSAASYRDAK